MKIDSPLCCPLSNESGWVSLYNVDTHDKAKFLSFSPPSLLFLSTSLFFTLTLMLQVLVAALLSAGLVCHSADLPASQWSGEEHRNLTLRQHRTCVENEQYHHQILCCLNCHAGEEEHIVYNVQSPFSFDGITPVDP